MALRDNQTLLVGFEGSQVAVHSSLTDVLDGVRHLFPAMIDAEARDIVTELVVEQNGQCYGLFERGPDLIVGDSLANILDHLSFVITERLVEAHPELLWFHAACAAREKRAVVIAAPWGCGKSTLVTGLAARGWTLLSDDLVPIDPRSDTMHAFPRLPMVREDPGRPLSRAELSDVVKVETAMVGEPSCRAGADIAALVFPNFRREENTRLVVCAPAEAALELLKHCRNFRLHGESAVQYVGHLATCAPAFRLSYGDGEDAANRLDSILRSESAGFLT